MIEKFDEKYVKSQDIKYFKQDLNFDDLKNEAKNIEISSSNNNLGINNEYYSKYVEPQIAKNSFPFEIVILHLWKKMKVSRFF